MSRNYDNWERLVAAVIKKEQLWQLFHAQSRSPSICSEASDFSSSFGSSPLVHDHESFNLPIPTNSSRFFWQQSARPKLVLVSDLSPPFSVKNVYVTHSDLLGRGTFEFGSVYAVAMFIGVKIVVKRLSPTIVSPREFRKNMQIAGNVRHENVVPLRGYYSSKDERLMLYDYYTEGSVSELLHGKNGQNRRHVDWESVLRIAIGAAKGLSEIHAQNGGKLVHGNIKASNVFLNSQQYGCISDLGLANTQNASQASDIYSFGILLLELLTGKSSVHVSGDPRAVELVKLVTSVKIQRFVAKFSDVDRSHYYTLQEQAVKMLQIGLSCVDGSVKKRPKMSEVVEMLQYICIRIPQAPRFRQPYFVSFVDDNSTFDDREDILRVSAEVLEKGTFGTSHKAILRNGTTILVKKLKVDSNTLGEFYQYMSVIGGVRHENVAGLKAYCLWWDQTLLVYYFYYQDNVSALLHGAGRIPLDWEIRLKIAVGASRGFAHIHSRNLVHGYIKSSSIFLNGQGYGLIMDAGLAKVTNTERVSEASDVYSFGNVLLELVSGKPFELMHNGDAISLVKWIQSVTPDQYAATLVESELLRVENDEAGTMQLLHIAMLATDPKRRPNMEKVVKMLDEVWGLYTRKQPSVVGSRLKNLLEDLLPTLIP